MQDKEISTEEFIEIEQAKYIIRSLILPHKVMKSEATRNVSVKKLCKKYNISESIMLERINEVRHLMGLKKIRKDKRIIIFLKKSSIVAFVIGILVILGVIIYALYNNGELDFIIKYIQKLFNLVLDKTL